MRFLVRDPRELLFDFVASNWIYEPASQSAAILSIKGRFRCAFSVSRPSCSRLKSQLVRGWLCAFAFLAPLR